MKTKAALKRKKIAELVKYERAALLRAVKDARTFVTIAEQQLMEYEKSRPRRLAGYARNVAEYTQRYMSFVILYEDVKGGKL